jgi:glycosyltransferase involved in cell wall biosynthesis
MRSSQKQNSPELNSEPFIIGATFKTFCNHFAESSSNNNHNRSRLIEPSTFPDHNPTMRIGLVTYEYPPQRGLGGVGTYMFRLAGALADAGHEVHVIAGPSHLPNTDQPNVTIHRIPAQHDIATRSRIARWLYWHAFAKLMDWIHPAIWHWLKWDLASFTAIRQLHKLHRFDLIEVPEHAANGWMAGKIHAWPIIVRIHCPWNLFVRINRFRANPLHRLLSYLEHRTLATVPDAITVPSMAMKQAIDHSWHLRRPPRIIPNFIHVPPSLDPLPAEDALQIILCVGRLEPLKGQDLLVRAFAKIANQFPRAILRLVGPDRWPGKTPFTDLLAHWIPDPNIRARIHLVGTVPLESIPSVFHDASIAVVPSRGFESFSFAALEAMAYGRPLIASHIGALPELIDHELSGLLIPPNSVTALATAIDRLLRNRRDCERFASAAHQVALDRYDTPRVLPQILKAYEEGSDYFYHVRAASSELTARQRLRALNAARAQ